MQLENIPEEAEATRFWERPRKRGKHKDPLPQRDPEVADPRSRENAMPPRHARTGEEGANVLVFALVMVGVAVLMVAGIYAYSSTNIQLNQRQDDYYEAVSAAEAATEKVVGLAT